MYILACTSCPDQFCFSTSYLLQHFRFLFRFSHLVCLWPTHFSFYFLFGDNAFFTMYKPAQKFSESLPLMCDGIDKAVQVHPLNLENYLHEKIYARLDKTVDLYSSWYNIDGVQYRLLTESFRNYEYRYKSGMMTVLFCSAVNPAGATHAIDVHKIHG